MRILKTRSLIKTVLGGVIIGLFLFYLLFNLLQNFDELREYTWTIHPGYLSLGLIVLVLSNLISPFVWWKILRSLGGNLLPLKALRIWTLSQSGRYVPGKIWGIVGRIYWTKNVDKILVIWSVWIETLLILLSGLILSVVLLSFFEIEVTIPYRKSLIFLLFTFIFLHPRLLERIISKFTSKQPKLKLASLLKWFFLYNFLWLGTGLGYSWILKGIGIEMENLKFISIFPISWILGFLAPFAPGGIGVREGVLTFFLVPSLGPGLASLSALIIRVASTLLDIILLGIGGISKVFEKSTNSSSKRSSIVTE